MSLSYGLDSLIQKHKLDYNDLTKFTVKNPVSLFDVAHQNELLKKEDTKFLRQHLFKSDGGFPDKKVGLPGLKNYDSKLPNVLKEIHQEDNDSTLSNEKIAEFVAENKDLILGHEQSEGFIKAHLRYALQNKSLKAKEKILNNKFSGKGKPVFTIRNNEIQVKFEPKTEPKTEPKDEQPVQVKNETAQTIQVNNNIINPTEKKQDESGIMDESREEKVADPDLHKAMVASLEDQTKKETNVTSAQKDKMRQILGENYKELKAKPKQKVSVIIIGKDGEIVATVKSLKYISNLEKDNRPVLIKNNHYFGKHTLLDNGNIILYVDSKAFNKLEKKGTKEQKKLLSQRKIQQTRSRVKDYENNLPKLDDLNNISLSGP